MKAVIAIIVVVLVAFGAFALLGPSAEDVGIIENEENDTTMDESTEVAATEGIYTVDPSSSIVRWAGKKPLVEGYVNSGVLTVTSGTITVAEDSSTGSFEIDMNTLSVSETKAKPGAETALEGHLKGEGWFNVEEFPTASFEIKSVTPNEGEGELMFDVVGDLTMKGETGELSFPAKIYQNEEGNLVAEASLEFDRTKWGITAGSGSFFDNLADNVIDDMVALSFMLVAEEDGAMAEELPMATEEEMEAMQKEEPIEEPVE